MIDRLAFMRAARDPCPCERCQELRAARPVDDLAFLRAATDLIIDAAKDLREEIELLDKRRKWREQEAARLREDGK